jgi:hypothetical protein
MKPRRRKPKTLRRNKTYLTPSYTTLRANFSQEEEHRDRTTRVLHRGEVGAKGRPPEFFALMLRFWLSRFGREERSRRRILKTA